MPCPRRRYWLTSPLPDAIVADANVLLSAIIGGRAALVLSHRRAPRCFAAHAVYDEIAEHLPNLASRRGLDRSMLRAAFSLLPITWMATESYVQLEIDARRRIAQRDPDHWPTVALALALTLPIWSQDKDIATSGLVVYSTGQLLDALRDLDKPER